MARLRTLKYEFFTNEHLADLGPHAMLFFAGLWCIADREGRLEDRPRRIRAEIMPYFEQSGEKFLAALAGSGFIIRYEAEGRNYIQITNFKKHQNPHIHERASTIPAPDEHSASMVHRTSTVDATLSLGSGVLGLGSCRESVSETDTPSLSSPSGEGVAKSPKRARKGKDNGIPEDFPPFWTLYPRHIGKAAAVKAWSKLTAEERTAAVAAVPSHERVWTAEERQASTIPHASTWLNGRRWEDELSAQEPEREERLPWWVNGEEGRPGPRQTR